MSLTAPISSSPGFLHGSTPLSHLWKPSSLSLPGSSAGSGGLEVRAMKTMQGRVVCSASDKTVAVQVTRLAPHPKYKRRVRKMKKYQAHDPENQFEVGDLVQLEKIRPISKTKTFLAVALPSRNPRPTADAELGIPMESDQPIS